MEPSVPAGGTALEPAAACRTEYQRDVPIGNLVPRLKSVRFSSGSVWGLSFYGNGCVNSSYPFPKLPSVGRVAMAIEETLWILPRSQKRCDPSYIFAWAEPSEERRA